MARSVLGGLVRPAPFAPGDDPGAAPWALPGSATDLPFRWHGVRPNLLITYLVGTVFLVFAIPTITEGADRLDVVLRIGYLVVLAAAYVGAAWTADASLHVRWGYVSGFTVLVLAAALLWGWEFANFGVYPATLIATLIPWHQARIALVAWSLVLAVAGLVGQVWMPLVIAALALGVGLGLAGWMENGRIRRMLELSQTRVEALTVAAERARISRDLHDILGHSLTAIAISSSLAARLADIDPAAAKEQMRTVEAIARQALADVRATVSGLTEIRLATEIAGARSILEAAGIHALTPAALPVLPEPVSELFGYVVRESVTNVVRHSAATRCVIEVDDRSVAVRDDGVGMGSRRAGNGLTGLRDRVAASGGVLDVSAVPGGGTIVRVVLDSSPEPVGAHS